MAGGIVSVTPNRTGSAADYVIPFTTSASGALVAGTDTVTIGFPAGTGVPSSINEASVRFDGDGACNVITSRAFSDGTAPTAVTVTALQVSFTVPEGAAGSGTACVGILASAGITNPAAAGTYTVGLSTSKDATVVATQPYAILQSAACVQTRLGSISSNQTWTVADSPVCVTGSVTVEAGVTLIVNPGAEVQFSGNTGLTIAGTLVALGGASLPIRFTSSASSPSPGSWSGIVLGPTSVPTQFDGVGGYASGSVLRHVVIEYAGGAGASAAVELDKQVWLDNSTVRQTARRGVYAIDNLNGLRITNSTFANNVASGSSGGALYAYGDNHVLDHNVFDHNSASDQGGAVFVRHNATITGNTFSFNSDSCCTGGGAIRAYDTVTITNNTFTSNSANQNGGAIYIGGSNTVSGNTFTGNSSEYGGAVRAFNHGNVISQNTFASNAARLGGAVHVEHNFTISRNLFVDNQVTYSDRRGAAVFVRGNVVLDASVSLNVTGSGDAPSAVTNAGAGTYTATLTSIRAGQKTLTASANGITIGTPVVLTFNPGAPQKYILSVTNPTPTPGSSVTVNAQLADLFNNPIADPIADPGHVVVWSSTGASFSFSSANSPTNAAGLATVQFTVSGVLSITHVITGAEGGLTGSASVTTQTSGGAFIVLKNSIGTEVINSAPAGSQIRVVGSSFAYPGSVMIHVNGVGQGTACDLAGVRLADNVPVQSNGTFNLVVTIPAECSGARSVLAIVNSAAVAGSNLNVVAASSIVRLRLNPSPAAAAVGGTVHLAIELNSGSNLMDGAEAVLAFDPSLLEVVNADGSLATQVTLGDCQFPALVHNVADNINGRVHLARGAALDTPQPISGVCNLGMVLFRAKMVTAGASIAFVLPPTSPATRVTRAGASLVLTAASGTVVQTGSVGLAFSGSMPSHAAHTYAFGKSISVHVMNGGSLNTSDSSTVVTLAIGEGPAAATLTCAPGSAATLLPNQRRANAGAVSFTGCKVDIPGDYTLNASAPAAATITSWVIRVGWAGDANHDCAVDILDFSVLVRTFGIGVNANGFNPYADFDGDDVVDVFDFGRLATLFGTRCPSLAASVVVSVGATQVRLDGSHYVAHAAVALTVDGAPLVDPPQIAAEANGSFTAFVVLGSGSHAIKAHQRAGRVIAGAMVTVP